MPEHAPRLSITLLVDQPDAWIVPYAQRLRGLLAQRHEVRLVHAAQDVPPGDLAFFLGCVRLVPAEVLGRNRLNLVVHESDLPRGRGWSPVAWQVLEGASEIPVVLFAATAEPDAGDVYLRDCIVLDGTELLPEIRQRQGEKTVQLVLRFVEQWPGLTPQAQAGEATSYPRRTRADDQLNPARPLAELFDRLRVADNDRYPAWFTLRGRNYQLRIDPLEPSTDAEEDSAC